MVLVWWQVAAVAVAGYFLFFSKPGQKVESAEGLIKDLPPGGERVNKEVAAAVVEKAGIEYSENSQTSGNPRGRGEFEEAAGLYSPSERIGGSATGREAGIEEMGYGTRERR